MKKTMLLGALLLATASAGFAQESRQDASISAMGVFSPQVNGNAVQVNASGTLGILASYRYMLTPRSALELNYSFSQYSTRYSTSFLPDVRIHTRQQEVTGAYVFNFRNYRNFYPFAEVGVGALIFTPIRDYATTNLDTKNTTTIGGLFGGGVAYELSPSWDIRAEYRGFVGKTPNFGLDNFKTNRWQVFSMPVVGVAYHF
ncbi:MAG: outer membrane beta-barrel protein [Edaphobacter sp.]|uniref:outer membrane beta-barrel protein n=1 Tax=Edaphobacter sp. TaxID=1934404 RepID=UPI00238FC334|nr:outer membrane beta-barrel protein [Edaphobacter sp.]MDE1177719.1 outer membrane beta-barrel protein [Edaphobacter sp.]